VLKLIIEDDEGRKTVVPFVRDEITIGRQEGNTVLLPERNVSRRHARLRRYNGTILVQDLGSYNGVRVNGERVTGETAIRDGDLIQIGDYDLALQRDTDQSTRRPPSADSDDETPPRGIQIHRNGSAATMKAVTAAAPTADRRGSDRSPAVAKNGADPQVKHRATSIIAVREIETSRASPARGLGEDQSPRVIVINTELAGREFKCERTDLRIGRTPENDISLDHRSLSRSHARLVRENSGEWRIIDLQSANGLSVNGERYAQATLSHLDTIELGHVKLKFVAPGKTFSFAPTSPEPKPQGRKLPLMFGAGAALTVMVGVAAFWAFSGTSEKSRQAPGKHAASAASKPSRTALAPTATASAQPGQELRAATAAAEAHALEAATGQAAKKVKPPPEPSPNTAKPIAAEQAKKLYDDGVALLTRKQNRQARDRFSKCLDVDSSFARCHLMLGSAAARLGEADIGAHHYEMFLRLSPTAPEAPKVRAFLEDYKHTKKRNSN
jgi:ABC transport system ATP-binding/permease protein